MKVTPNNAIGDGGSYLSELPAVFGWLLLKRGAYSFRYLMVLKGWCLKAGA